MKISVDTFCKKRRRDGETGRRRDGETARRFLPVSLSPRLPVALSLFLSVFLAACGKIGAPLPPERREPLRTEELRVEQRGAQLILSCPFTRTSRMQLQRIDVFRLVEPLDAPMGLPIETFSERASVIYSILADDIPLGSSSVVYNDAL